MKKLTLTISIVFLQIGLLFANSNPELIEEANEAYNAGNYDIAIAKYDRILDSVKESAELYYNLGNAYFKNDQLAPAILNYERAKQLEPFNERINHNLEFAKQQQKDAIEKLPVMFYVRWWHKLTKLFPLKTWATLSIILIFISSLLWALFISSRSVSKRKAFFWPAIVTAILFVFTLFISLRNYNHIREDKSAIIFENVVTGKSSPSKDSENLFIIHEGLKVHILNKVGEWYEVRLPDGTVGWIHKSNMKVI
ncbi:MAG: tetratricopeptide repeat protein [Bacteroidales bacterium]|nr:tetratricopeptide repeat protein [Bacteroidales bacterium]